MRRGLEHDAVEPLVGRRPPLIGMLAVMPAALVLYALVAGAVMQTPVAARAWPRLRPGATRADSDRMVRP